MSFSGKVKEELARNISSARHCQIAELTAFIGMCGTVVINSFDRCSIKIRTENILVARKVFTLIEKTGDFFISCLEYFRDHFCICDYDLVVVKAIVMVACVVAGHDVAVGCVKMVGAVVC